MEQQLTPEQVFQVLKGTFQNDNTLRQTAEAQLRQWEGDAAPGFLHSLIAILEQVQTIEEVSHATCSCSEATHMPFTRNSTCEVALIGTALPLKLH